MCVAICIVATLVPTYAAGLRASDYISSYSIDANIFGRTIRTDFTVRGAKSMDKLGCESIKIYEKMEVHGLLLQASTKMIRV